MAVEKVNEIKASFEQNSNSSTGVALHHDFQHQSGCFCPPSANAKWARLIAQKTFSLSKNTHQFAHHVIPP